MTSAQYKIHAYVVAMVRRRGYGPTIRELATHFDVSRQAMAKQVGGMTPRWLRRRGSAITASGACPACGHTPPARGKRAAAKPTPCACRGLSQSTAVV